MKIYQQCKRCVLDTNDTPVISFDEVGVCSYCQDYDEKVLNLGSTQERKTVLDEKISKIKKAGEGRQFDCLLGLSGGSDSSYMALLAKEFGLRPLVVHLDNGWNSDSAVRNIEKICEKLDYKLYTYVIDWEEFVGLQKAYLKAGVIDIEVLTDHAIYAILYKLAYKFKIRYTLNGFNLATEAIMPKGWTYNKRDYLNIKDIVNQFGGGIKIKTFPKIPFLKALYYYWIIKLESFQVLNYIEYDKEKAKEELTQKVDWQDYGGKHYESVFTKFYQAYILPVKFGVDKRRAHLSNLICSGQITREVALEELKVNLYRENEFKQEKEYILKKFQFTEEEFELIMKEAPRKHESFDSDQRLWNIYFRLIKIFKFGK